MHTSQILGFHLFYTYTNRTHDASLPGLDPACRCIWMRPQLPLPQPCGLQCPKSELCHGLLSDTQSHCFKLKRHILMRYMQLKELQSHGLPAEAMPLAIRMCSKYSLSAPACVLAFSQETPVVFSTKKPILGGGMVLKASRGPIQVHPACELQVHLAT